MDINKISQKYDVRYLNKENVDEISKIMNGNQQFYKYTDSKPTKENILNDMSITPPGIDISQKYYIGFYESNELIAIMDLIDGYPSSDTAYIGFFMVNSKYQGKGLGSSIIEDLEIYLKSINKKAIQLAIDKGNPQSTNFWQKNGFLIFDEVKKGKYIKLKAKKTIID